MFKNTTPVLLVPLTLIVMTVCFGYNSAVIEGPEQKALDDLVQQLDSVTDYTVHLTGHTDATGSNDYNLGLSKRRVLEVRNYLISKNVDSMRIQIDYSGEDQPLLPNTTEENRAQNRRVELTVSGTNPISSGKSTNHDCSRSRIGSGRN